MTRKIEESARPLLDMPLEQRSRYRMSLAQLRRTIDHDHQRCPFPRGSRHFDSAAGLNTGSSASRFPDELTALRAYARAAVRLAGSSSPVWSMVKRLADQVPARISTSTSAQMVMRRGKERRGGEPSFAKEIEDYVDVGMRIRLIERTRMDLLLAYYVLGYKAKEIAEEYEINTAALGGRLGQARTVLRRALQDILPAAAGNTGTADTAKRTDPVDPTEERRRKVARFLRRRLSADFGRQAEDSDGFEEKWVQIF